MRALLDTNIIIHRENQKVSNYSIGHLFRWLDRLNYDKIIHPYSINEIKKYKDPEIQDLLSVKLESYEILKTVTEPDKNFLKLIDIPEKTENDKIDDCLLYELYLNHVDILITEDKKLRDKAAKLGLEDCVYSIDDFISDATAKNPSLIEYKMLAVRKEYFGNIDVNDPFFDSLRVAYPNFNNWFTEKCDEEAYVCKSDEGKIVGFLYLKTEGINENYSDITPVFTPKRRLKVGTFKIESTGFRLGERFIKIIFDNAIQGDVDEIYLTIFDKEQTATALIELLQTWGFVYYGIKYSYGRKEKVFVKNMRILIPGFSCHENFPNISYHCNKYILPISYKYHTSLLPDSKLNTENEIDFIGREPHRYALEKIYISWASTNGADSGDILVFYRMAEMGSIKKYKSVITTIAVIDKVIENINSEKELLSVCQNRSVFTNKQLHEFWGEHNRNLKIIKFIFVKSLEKRLTLEYLQNKGIVDPPKGPRPFTRINDEQFDDIIFDSETKIRFIDK